MPFVPVPNTALAELVCSLDSEIVETTLWFQREAGWDATTLNTLGAALITWWGTNIAPHVTTAVNLLNVKATDMTSNTAAAVVVSPPAVVPGTGTGTPVPNNVAFVIKFTTAFRGRFARGRNYVFGFNEADVTASRINSVLADQFVDAYEALTAVETGAGCTHVVASRFANGDPRVTGFVSPVLSYSYTDLIVDTQRRRLP